MKDAGAVRMIDGVADLAGEIERAAHVEGAITRDDVLERFSGDVLHHDEEDVLQLLRGENGNDVGMAHRGKEPGLLQHLREIEMLLMRNLERDLFVDPRVLGQVDGTEAAAAERRQNAVLPNELTAEEHRTGLYGR